MVKTAEICHDIHVAVEDARTDNAALLWRPDDKQIQDWLTVVLQHRDLHAAEVSVALVDASESQALNQRYRKIAKATNVLSFPAGTIPQEFQFLGDIVICAEVVATEALEQGKSEQAHWAHMLIHGLLHLLGFDHRNEQEAVVMEAMEIQVLNKLGFASPYEIE